MIFDFIWLALPDHSNIIKQRWIVVFPSLCFYCEQIIIMSLFTLFRQKIKVKNRLYENTLNSTKSNSGFALSDLKKHTVNTLNRLFLRIKSKTKSPTTMNCTRLYLSFLLKKIFMNISYYFSNFSPPFCSESSKLRVCSSSSSSSCCQSFPDCQCFEIQAQQLAKFTFSEFLSHNKLSHRQPPGISCDDTSISSTNTVDCEMSRKPCQLSSQNPGTRFWLLQKSHN